MKLIEIENPYMDVGLSIHGIDVNKNAILDTGFTLGINVPLSYKDAIIREAVIKGKRIRRLLMNIADGTEHRVFATECNIKINDKKIDATITCMGNRFIIGREVIKQIMDDPFLAIKGEKLEVTI